MAACSCQNKNNSMSGIGELPEGAIMMLPAAAAGGFVSTKLDGMLDKLEYIKTNANGTYIKQGIKIAAAIALAMYMPEQPAAQGFSAGMIAMSGTIIIKKLMNDATPIAGTTPVGTQNAYIAGPNGQVYMTTPQGVIQISGPTTPVGTENAMLAGNGGEDDDYIVD